MICTLTLDQVAVDLVAGLVGPGVEQKITVPRGQHVTVEFEYLPEYRQNYRLFLQTSSSDISANPVAVTAIGFDHFFEFKSLLIYQGTNLYDTAYLEHCKQHQIPVDLDVHDNNILFFTGSLEYAITHPAILNVNAK